MKNTLIKLTTIITLAVVCVFEAVVSVCAIVAHNLSATSSNDTTSYIMIGDTLATGPELYGNPAAVQELYQRLTNTPNADLSTLQTLIDTKTGGDKEQLVASDTFRTNNNGKNLQVTFGGQKWDVMALSNDRTGANVVLTLWLADALKDNDGTYLEKYFNPTYTQNEPYSANKKYPDNMYGSSYIRAFVTNGTMNNGAYLLQTGADTLDGTYAADPNYPLKEFLSGGQYEDYLLKPAAVKWQETEFAEAFDVILPNEAYGTPHTNIKFSTQKGMPNYLKESNKNIYQSWQNDYLWLPSLAETGDKYINSLWSSSIQQIALDTDKGNSCMWLRSGHYYFAFASYILRTDCVQEAPAVDAMESVRPALHLNLTELDAVAPSGPAAINAQPVKVTYDGTVQQITTANATWLESGDTVTYYADAAHQSQLTNPPRDAGTYYVTVTRDGVDDADTTFIIEQRAITVTIDNQTSYQGQALKPLTATVTDGDIVTGDSADDVYRLYISTNNTNINTTTGNYIINGERLNANYAITFVNGTYTVSAPPAINARPVTVIYNGAGQTVNATNATNTGTWYTDDLVFTFYQNGTKLDELPINAGHYIGYAAHDYAPENTVSFDFKIEPKNIAYTGALVAADKVYDGNNEVQVSGLSLPDGAIFPVDQGKVKLEITANFNTVIAQNDSTVVTHIYLANTPGYTQAANNYNLTSIASPSLTANITKRPITVSNIKGVDKFYDQTTAADLNYSGVVFGNIVPGDVLAVSAKGVFARATASANEHDAITINLSNITLGGKDADNYVLADEGQQTITSALIKKIALKVQIDGVSQQATTDVTVQPLPLTAHLADGSEILPGDDPEPWVLSLPDNFSLQNVTSYDINGAPKATCVNYELNFVGGEKAYVVWDSDPIYAQNVILTYNGQDQFINSTAIASWWQEGDELVYTQGGRPATPHDAGVYNVLVSRGTTRHENITLTIQQLPVKVTGITAVDRDYNRGTGAELDYTNVQCVGQISGDVINVVAVGTFVSANAGERYVEITNIALDNANYVVAADSQTSTTATINKVAVVVSGITAADKTYDKTASVVLDCSHAHFTGRLGVDVLSVTATGYFSNEAVGVNKNVTIINLTLVDASGNYFLAEDGQQTTTTATINPANLTLTVDPKHSIVGEPLVALTARITEGNLVGDDIATDVYTLTTTADPDVIGQYNIAVKTLDDNYHITVLGGTNAYEVQAEPTPVDPDPEDPTDPEDPEDPENPEDPNPENPTDPTDPEDPENPTDPENPNNPENPNGSEDQENPGEATTPGNPTDTEQPSNPENPDQSNKPSEPSKPKDKKPNIFAKLEDVNYVKVAFIGAVVIMVMGAMVGIALGTIGLLIRRTRTVR